MRFDKFAHQRDDTGDEFRLLDRAVREGRIVGDVEEIGIRPHGRDLAVDRESAEAGIEDQNGFRRGHWT